MIKKLCFNCKKLVWHNAMKKTGEYRCTHCGIPVGHNTGTPKYDAAHAYARARQSF